MSFEKPETALMLRLYGRFLESHGRTLPEDTTALKSVLDSTLNLAWRESILKGGDLADLAAQYVFQIMRKGCFGEDALPMAVALLTITFGLNGSWLDAREVTLRQELLGVQAHHKHASDLATWLRDNQVPMEESPLKHRPLAAAS
jgi:prophage maintenance system killer protein